MMYFLTRRLTVNIFSITLLYSIGFALLFTSRTMSYRTVLPLYLAASNHTHRNVRSPNYAEVVDPSVLKQETLRKRLKTGTVYPLSVMDVMLTSNTIGGSDNSRIDKHPTNRFISPAFQLPLRI